MAKEKQSKKTKQTGTEAVHQRNEVASCNDNISRSSNRAFKLYLRNGLEEEIETVKLLEKRFSENENSIYNIKYMVVYLQTNNTDSSKIDTVINVVRGKYNCRFPVVFRICEEGQGKVDLHESFSNYLTQTYGENEFLRTYGLGQFLYSEKAGCFLLPESESKSQTKTEGPTPSSESSDSPTGEGNTNASVGQQLPDHDLIIEEFMNTQYRLNDLQMEHLKMYVRPVNIIPRLRHDGGNAKTQTELKSYQTQLNDLLNKENIRSEVENKIQSLTQRNIKDKIDNTSENESITNNESYQETNKQKEDENLRRQIEEFKHMCDIAEERILENQNDLLNGTSVKTPIYALLLDDRCNDNDIKAFIDKAKEKGIHIIPTANVAEAEKELLTLEYLKHHLAETENKNDDKDPRYTVILVDLLLKEKHTAPNDLYSGTESLIVSRRQGYDFVRDLAKMGRQYGVILLSTLPRNFKTMVAGSLPLRTRNFPYKDGGKLAIPEYQQLLIDMIVEAHDENNEEAIFRAFTKRGFAMHYIRYMINNKGFEKVNEKTKVAIKSFLNAIKDGKKNWEKKESENSKGRTKKVDESQWLSKLSTKYAPIMNEGDVNAIVEEFLNNIYSWSWKSYCDQGCPSEPNYETINNYCQKKLAISNNSIKELPNNDIISAFIKDCYNSTLSFKTTFELYAKKEDVRNFVKHFFIYKNVKNKYPDNDSLTTRFIARRLTLFLFFWANLSKYASDEYVGKEVTEKNSKGKNKSAQGSSTHTLTAFDCVNQILNRNGLETPKEFDSPTSLVNNGVWLNTIYFQRTRTPECPYMTPDERDFFLNLFQDDNFQFELKTNDEQLNTVLNKLEVDQGKCPRTMCSELIYYFK